MTIFQRMICLVVFASCLLLAGVVCGQWSQPIYPSLPSFGPAAPKPSAACTSQLTPLVLQLGEGVPLPRMFRNPTSKRVTFIISMQSNSLFGPAQELSRLSLASHTGQTSSSPSIHPTGLRTPVGSAHVVINVTTDRTGSEIVGRCDYQLTMKAPPGVPGIIPRPIVTQRQLSFLYQLPVRMCVLEGSALAAGKTAGQTIGGKKLLDLLESVNNDIWFPNAQIAFSSAIETGFPVIADPSPPGQGCGVLGELNAAGIAAGDGLPAETNCAAAWQEKYPGKVGIPIIFARNFCESLSIKGGAQGPDPSLQVKSRLARSGGRGDDLCGVPKRLLPSDIVNQNRRPFVIIIEFRDNNPNIRNNLAHELGHNLFLGHGNGLDDNHDGRAAGSLGGGPRRYDEYCDPGWMLPPDNVILAEDQATPSTTCEQSGSLMNASAGCTNLRPLQVETARGVARFLPGFLDTTPQGPGIFRRVSAIWWDQLVAYR